MKWIQRLSAAVLTASSVACGAQAVGVDYPRRPITLLVPYSPGGAADIVGRLVAQKAGQLMRQSIVVENHPGAGGSLAAGLVAKSAPDGYTLLLSSVAIDAINPNMMSLSYDPQTDLAPVAIVAVGFTTLVVSSKSPFDSLQGLISYAKSNPGKLNFGSSGNGSITHLTGELFALAAGIEIGHVPYRGNPQVINDLVGGQIQLTFDGGWKTDIGSGLVRPLGYTGPRRAPSMPSVPTLAEVLPNYTGFEPWIGIAASGRTPAAILDKLSEVMLKVSQDPDMIARLEASGFEPRSLGRMEMAAVSRRDFKLLGELIRQKKLRP